MRRLAPPSMYKVASFALIAVPVLADRITVAGHSGIKSNLLRPELAPKLRALLCKLDKVLD